MKTEAERVKQRQNETAVSDEQIVAALISNSSIQAAAQACGISTRAIYDRMGYRNFKAVYAAAKADLIREAVLTMNGRLNEAVATIYSIMNDKGNPPATRLAAARVMLDNAAKFMDRLTYGDGYAGSYSGPAMESNPDRWD